MTDTLTIMPDYGGAYIWHTKGDAEASAGVGSFSGLPMVRKGMRMHPHPLTKEFEEWQAYFDRTVPGQMDNFDWRTFQAEGIDLARRLKLSVGDKYRIVYEKPTEDPFSYVQERREVMMDGDLVDLQNRSQINKAARTARINTST